MNPSRFQIQPTTPFAFGLALAYLRTSPSSIIEVITADSYRRAIRVNGKDCLVTVRAASRSADEYSDGLTRPAARSTTPLDVELLGSALDPEDRRAAGIFVRRLFSTDADVSAFLDAVQGDPVFSHLARGYRGLRPVLIPNLFETLVWAIIGQQINVRFAATCKRALVELCGERLPVDGQEYLIFPEPERIASLNPDDLAAIQFSRQKTRYVLNLAREICEGHLDLESLRGMPAAEALPRLENVLGVGRWTAEYVLMRGLGHPDVIPAADGGLRRIIGRAYGLRRSASESEVRQFAERWAGWRGYAAFYWWFALQQEARGEFSRR